MNNDYRLSIRIPQNLYERLFRAARGLRRKTADLIRIILQDGVDEIENVEEE